MAMNNDRTTLVCLFHHQDQAEAAVRDLMGAGIPQSSISRIGNGSQGGSAQTSQSEPLGTGSTGTGSMGSGSMGSGTGSTGTVASRVENAAARMGNAVAETGREAVQAGKSVAETGHTGSPAGSFGSQAGSYGSETETRSYGSETGTAGSQTGNYGAVTGSYSNASLAQLGVPERDQQHLMEGVRDGGEIVAVSAIADHIDAVEAVFSKHKATKIDESGSGNNDRVGYDAPLAGAAAGAAAGSATGAALTGKGAENERMNLTGERSIPVIEEQLVVGKRTVDSGGVRVFRRVVEIPVEESVNLREERVNVERHAVNRPIGAGDEAFGRDRTIELTETSEEAVIGKNARVVEEVHVGKSATERTEHIRDTVRKTEVEVEEIAAGSDRNAPRRTS